MAKLSLGPRVNAHNVHGKCPPQLSLPDTYSPKTTPLQKLLILRLAKTVSSCAISLPLCSTVCNKCTQLHGRCGFSIREPKPPNPNSSESMCLTVLHPLTSSSQSPKMHTMSWALNATPSVQGLSTVGYVESLFSSVSPRPTAQILSQT